MWSCAAPSRKSSSIFWSDARAEWRQAGGGRLPRVIFHAQSPQQNASSTPQARPAARKARRGLQARVERWELSVERLTSRREGAEFSLMRRGASGPPPCTPRCPGGLAKVASSREWFLTGGKGPRKPRNEKLVLYQSPPRRPPGTPLTSGLRDLSACRRRGAGARGLSFLACPGTHPGPDRAQSAAQVSRMVRNARAPAGEGR